MCNFFNSYLLKKNRLIDPFCQSSWHISVPMMLKFRSWIFVRQSSVSSSTNSALAPTNDKIDGQIVKLYCRNYLLVFRLRKYIENMKKKLLKYLPKVQFFQNFSLVSLKQYFVFLIDFVFFWKRIIFFFIDLLLWKNNSGELRLKDTFENIWKFFYK